MSPHPDSTVYVLIVSSDRPAGVNVHRLAVVSTVAGVVFTRTD